MIPTLVQLEKANAAQLTLPPHLEKMIPKVIANDPTAKMLFLAEGLKAAKTGKRTSSAEMTTIGVGEERDPKRSYCPKRRNEYTRMVNAAVKFIDKWNELVPLEKRD